MPLVILIILGVIVYLFGDVILAFLEFLVKFFIFLWAAFVGSVLGFLTALAAMLAWWIAATVVGRVKPWRPPDGDYVSKTLGVIMSVAFLGGLVSAIWSYYAVESEWLECLFMTIGPYLLLGAGLLGLARPVFERLFGAWGRNARPNAAARPATGGDSGAGDTRSHVDPDSVELGPDGSIRFRTAPGVAHPAQNRATPNRPAQSHTVASGGHVDPDSVELGPDGSIHFRRTR